MMRAASRDKRLVEERRRQIADGAVSVFIKQGFEKATTRQIADASGMTIGNVYNYVKSKQDILYLAMDYAVHLGRTDLGHASSDPVAALREAMQTAYSDMNDHQDYILLIYQESKKLSPQYRRRIMEFDSEYAARFGELLSDGIEKHVFRTDMDPFLVSQSIVTLAHMWCFRRWLLKDRCTFEHYLERQLDFVFAAISLGPPPPNAAISGDSKLMEERRRQIADVAVHIFVKQGFEEVTMRQIADACEMSVGTLYNHVKSKEDVLFLAMEQIMRMGLPDARRVWPEPRGALRETIENSYSNMNEDQDYILFIYQESKNLPSPYRQRVMDMNRQFAERFQRLLEDGVSSGVFRPGIDPFIVSQNIVTLGHMWCFRRWLLRDACTFERYLEHQLDFIFSAISSDAPPGHDSDDDAAGAA
jgi:AcrR family transcriptional regulator